MKKLILLVYLALGISTLRAQDAPAAKPAFQSSVAVKWNPLSLAFGKIGILGEYNLKHKKSITFGIGIPSEFTTKFTMDNKKREIAMKTFSIMAGYRMYLGKKSMSGFYFEPYAKYVKNDAVTNIDGTIEGTTQNFLTTSAYKGFGVGAQLGVQVLIAKRVTLDFFLLGPEANSAKHSVVMQQTTPGAPWSAQGAADAQQEIEDNIGDLPIIGKKIVVKVDAANKRVTSDYSGFLPGFRAGLSLGIRF